MSEEDNLIIQINDDSNNNEQKKSHSREKLLFSNESIRISFIRKVYGILSVQLSMTVLLCLFSCCYPPFAKFQITQKPLLSIAAVISIALSLLLFCFKNLGRSVPINYIFCFAFTLCESYMVSCVCSLYEPKTVLMAAIMTLGVTLALTVYAWQTKKDFTIYGGILYMLAIGLLIATIFTLFVQMEFLKIITSFAGVIIYGIYLIYDTQLIIGQGRYSLTIDDYILGAIAIYLDIIIIFLKLLKLLGSKKK